MWRDVLARCWWMCSLLLVPGPELQRADGRPADGVRARRGTAEPNYWSYSGTHGPTQGWGFSYPECNGRHQSPIDIVDQDALVSPEYQELNLEGFDSESSNRTSMKNTGKTVAIVLRDQYFMRGAGLPGRFKAERVEFHWGPGNASDGSEHGIDGRRFPVEMQIFMYNSDDFDSLAAAIREGRSIAAAAVFFQVGRKDNPAVDPIIHGLRGVVHHEKETFLEPFVLKDLLPSSLRSYYRYTGSLTTPPCSEAVEWIVFSKPVHVSYKQLEAFYSIFTTEQQDHVKSVEYLRSNFRPVQSLDDRRVYKSALKDAWKTSPGGGGPTAPHATDTYRVCSSAPTNMKVQLVNSSALQVQWAGPLLTFHPPITHFLVSYSWTSLDDSYEETHVTDANHKLEAIISPVSPDVLYLFRVQSVCMNDMRSDFSQSMLFRANTTRIFEGTRIVKSGMPTLAPPSSADMAPISSGSSTWTSAGLPFSFVSMATGIGPPSSGSQATVASLLTSALLAGLGFGGGAISSFPAAVRASARTTPHRGNAPRHGNHDITSKMAAADAQRPATAEECWMENGGLEEEGEEEEEDEEEEETAPRNRKRAGKKASHRQSQARVEEKAAAAVQKREEKEEQMFTNTQRVARRPGAQWLLPLLTPSPLTFTCILLLLIYCRRRVQRNQSHSREQRSSTQLEITDSAPNLPIPDTVGAVPVQDFLKHVSDLYSNNGQGFSDQFEAVQRCTARLQLTSHSSQHADNKHKNRYVNISAYDHSRVKLRPGAGTASDNSDYINANYVDGYNAPRAFIAAQGPLKATLEDFWRMVWEQNAATIVMITNLVEGGRRKCEQYWPSHATEEYGAMTVTLISSHVHACYTERRLALRYVSRKTAGRSRSVLHYQFTQWPDMGVPDYTLPVLAFIHRSCSSPSPEGGPTVVHCSAGVGRTGTYIVLRSMMQQIKEQSNIDVLNFLKHIRTQRNYLVQTQDQYIFIHEVLMEAILGQDVGVSVQHLHKYVSSITAAKDGGGGGCTRLEHQFKLVTGCRNRKCSIAQRESNKEKNRNCSIVPTDQARVGLSLMGGARDSDYINASYIMGYSRPDEFIVTQRPLPHTIRHFWRMIWEQDVQLIVMLPGPKPQAEDECVYWPPQEELLNCDTFTVSLVSLDRVLTANGQQISVRHFLLQATQDDYVLEVRHFQCPEWPSADASLGDTVELLGVLRAAARDTPTVVHDREGGVCAASLCALVTLWQQMQFDGVVNVYHVVKMIELMRPRVFTHTDQYHFLFRALLGLRSAKQDPPTPRNVTAPPTAHMGGDTLVCTFENCEPGESVQSLV